MSKMTSGAISSRVKTVGAIFLMLCFCLGYVKGGCLSYGHSCWGGHGKRSSGPPDGRPIVRSIPAPPLAARMDRMGSPITGRDALYAMSRNGYYQPLERLYRIPPAAVIDLLNSDSGADSSASSENDVDFSKLVEDSSADGEGPNHEPQRPRDDQLQRPRQPRRKTPLFQTATNGKQQNPVAAAAVEDDIGRMLLEVAAASETDNRDLLKLLNSTPPRRYE